MVTGGKILAWITPGDDQVVAAILSAAAVPGCRPMTQSCRSRDEALRWVEARASAAGFDTEWLDTAPAHAIPL